MKTKVLFGSYHTELSIDSDRLLHIVQEGGEDEIVLTRSQALELSKFIQKNWAVMADSSEGGE